MNNFNWEEFKTRKIAVHCKNDKEGKDFLYQYCNKKYVDFYNICISNNFNFLLRSLETHYCVFNKNDLYIMERDFCKNQNYKIIEWSDYMSKEFTKDDLKVGYVVEFRDGRKALVMPSRRGKCLDLCDNDRCLVNSQFEGFTNDLFYTSMGIYISTYDIVRVYGYSNIEYKTTELSANNRELLWQREKVISIEEAEQMINNSNVKYKIVGDK